MLPRLEYLAWAIERYGHVRFDLGASGMKEIPAESVAPPAELLAGVTDPRSRIRWAEAIARRFGVDVAEVVPTLGTTHGLWATYAGLLAAGDHVLVEAPAYEPLVRLAEGVGARVVHFVRDVGRGARLDPESVAAAITPRTKMVVVSNLHNPTGVYAEDAVIAQIAAHASRVGALVLVDEVYRDLVDFDPVRGRTAFHVAPNVIVTSSLTKVYGLGWARAGWVIAPRGAAAEIRAATLHDAGGISYAIASIGEIALAHLTKVHGLSLAARAHDEAAMAVVDAFVAVRPHLSWSRPRGSIFGFVVDARGGDLRPAIERAVDEEQVIVAPGAFFGAPAGFRLRFGALAPGILEEGLHRLGRVLDR